MVRRWSVLLSSAFFLSGRPLSHDAKRWQYRSVDDADQSRWHGDLSSAALRRVSTHIMRWPHSFSCLRRVWASNVPPATGHGLAATGHESWTAGFWSMGDGPSAACYVLRPLAQAMRHWPRIHGRALKPRQVGYVASYAGISLEDTQGGDRSSSLPCFPVVPRTWADLCRAGRRGQLAPLH